MRCIHFSVIKWLVIHLFFPQILFSPKLPNLPPSSWSCSIHPTPRMPQLLQFPSCHWSSEFVTITLVAPVATRTRCNSAPVPASSEGPVAIHLNNRHCDMNPIRVASQRQYGSRKRNYPIPWPSDSNWFYYPKSIQAKTQASALPRHPSIFYAYVCHGF